MLVYFGNCLEVHVNVYVKVVYSWLGWNPKRSQTVGRLSGRNLLVYFESYLEVHVKVYVKVVYSRLCWNPKGRKQSRNCLLHLCSNFLTVRQTFPDFYLKNDFSLL